MTDIDAQRQELMQNYDGLNSLEQAIVQLFAVVYQSINKTQLVVCLSKSGIRDPDGKVFVPKTLNPILQRLTDQQVIETIDTRYRCHPLLMEVVTRQVVQQGNFEALAQAIQEADPLQDRRFYLQASVFNSYEQAVREIRIALYRGDFKKMYQQLDASYEGYPQQFSQYNPLLLIFSNPFDKAWLLSLPGELLDSILLCMLQHSLNVLTPAENAFELLLRRVGEPGSPRYMRYLLAEQLILRGRLPEAWRQLQDKTESAGVLALRGWLHFLQNDDQQALADYSSGIKLLRKAAGKRKVYLAELAGVFYVMALLHEGSAGSLKQAGDILTIVQSEPGFACPATYQALQALLSLRQGTIKYPDIQLADDVKTADFARVDGIFLLIILYWLDALEQTRLKTLAVELYERARRCNYLWLADELQTLLAELGHGQRPAAPHNMRRLTDLIRRKAPWEHALDALMTVASGGPEKPAQASQMRLVWWLFPYADYCSIEPREQKIDKHGNWTKGRPVALKRLYKNNARLDYLSEQDLRVCAAIRQEYQNYYGAADYEFDSDQALLALVGHPLLFWADQPSVSVELVKGEPELIVEQKKKDQLLIRFAPQVVPQRRIHISRETPTRLKVIEINDAHKRVAAIVGTGLTLPQSARDRVFAAIGAIANIVTVQSSIGGVLENLETVTADSQPHLHLLPFGDGLKCELLVRPFHASGPYYRPGSGGQTVIAEVRGKRLQASRDLQQEQQQAQQVVARIPTLQRLAPVNGEWTLGEPDDCLEMLLELQTLDDGVTVAWPEGEKFQVTRPATLDHFRIQINRRKQWFDITGELKLDEDLVLDMHHLLELTQNTPGRFVKLENGQFLALTQEFRRRLDELASFTEPTAKGVRFHPLAALALDDFTQEAGFLKGDKYWKQHIRRLREAQALQPELPSTFQGELRDYQLAGFQWLMQLAHWGVGACLADDMGLGKTIQALAMLLTRAHAGPSLVVAPTSVGMNWQAEALRFTPTLNVILFGSRERQKLLDTLGPFDLLVCSYGLLQNEIEKLAAKQWQIVILDEAQAIKNMTTKRSQAAMELQGEFKMITTGTPIENHLGELWNLFRFINPGLLGSLEHFNRRFALPIERDQDHQARNKLKKLIQPFILRRMKSEVLEELPPRTEIVLHVEQGSEERALYEALRRQAVEALAGSEASGGQKHVQILAAIMKLRRVCCNPQLVIKDTGIGSAKLEVFADLLEELLASRHKALVFSQFVDHLSILRALLEDKRISYQYLDGSTPIMERKKRVDAFQAGYGDVFLISLKAGGVGLNLTAADYVIHMDPWWNPAVEDQAADRAHRMGQQRPVTIYRLVTRDTIEEKIVDLHQHKRDLATSLLEGNDMSGKLSADELLALLQEE